MNDAPDYDLYRPGADASSPDEPPPTRRVGLWIVIALLVLAGGFAAYVVFMWRPATTAAPPPSDTAAASNVPLPPLGGKGDAIELPPLDESDRLVRTLVQRLSESPAIMAWLPTTGLIRNFTVAVTNIAEGVSPAKQEKVLRPTAPFRVVDRGGTITIDPRSYDRYNTIADAVASVDPAGAATLYATLKPRIEEAHRDLGVQNASFDRTLERALVSLLETPTVDTPPRLRPKGIGFAYADQQLEDLTAAQKQLLRMGPRNARVIKARLREIAIALGIPASRLPTR
jgi:hypothetical protein